MFPEDQRVMTGHLQQVSGGFMRGLTALQAGNLAEAVTWLEPTLAQVQAGNAKGWIWLVAPWLALAYAGQGEVDRALQLFADHLSEPALRDMTEPYLISRYAHGRVLAVAGEVEGAEAALEEALALAQQLGNPFFQIEVHRALGQLYRAQGRTGEAEEHFSQVLELGAQLAGAIEDPGMHAAHLAAPPFAEARP